MRFGLSKEYGEPHAGDEITLRYPRGIANKVVWTPQPKIVTPPDMDNAVVAPPSDAVVLLGLKDNAISEWVNCEEGKPVGWQIENGIMTVKPHWKMCT